MTKIEKYKIFEYAYNELPEQEVAKIEAMIQKDPEALKILNEYLFLKQNLADLPSAVFSSDKESIKNKNATFDRIIHAASKYIVWDLRPNLVFAISLSVFGFLMFNINQSPLLNSNEIMDVETIFNLRKSNNQNNSSPLLLNNPNIDYFTLEDNNVSSPLKKQTCEEKKIIHDKNTILLKFCINNEKQWKIVEQAILIDENLNN